MAEAFYVLYSRFLGQYDLMQRGAEGTTFKNTKDYWMALGLLMLGFFLFSFLKSFLLYVVVLNSNK